MKILVFTDVHGNYNALSKLASTSDFKSADRIVFLGDVIIGMIRPNECTQLLSDLNIECLLGNNDSYVVNKIPENDPEITPKKHARLLYMKNLVTDENKNIIKNWKKDLTLLFGDKKFYFTHYPWESDENVVQSPKENNEKTRSELFKNIDADYYIFGHEHTSSHITYNEKHYYCLGSLGLKYPAPYLIITNEDNSINLEEKYISPNINEEIDLMDKAGYDYNKNKIKRV